MGLGSRFRGGRGVRAAVGALLAFALGTACGSSSTAGKAAPTTPRSHSVAAGTTKVTIGITPLGCAPEPAGINKGTTEFDFHNTNANSVSKVQLRSSDGTQVLTEQAGITPGRSGSFTRALGAGTYRIVCPGAQQDTWDLRVTDPDAAESWHDEPELVAAVNGYGQWVRQEVGELATATRAFVAAVKAGRLDEAKVRYARARIGYERVETVAEGFGDLDHEIDGRIGDFLNPANFSGFHRLERAIFVDKTTQGMTPFADGLAANVNQLQRLVATQKYSPIYLASGATDLVNEVEESKITGEEERYSGIDLVDFRGNLQGAMELVHELAPFLKSHDPSLLSAINAQSAAVDAALAKYEAQPGYDGSGFVNYSAVSDPERRQLSGVINSLAEKISELVVVVAR